MASKIETRGQLEEFLNDKPVWLSRVVAVRVALRVFPLAMASNYRDEKLIQFLRSCFVSWASVLYPNAKLSKIALSAGRYAGRYGSDNLMDSAGSAAYAIGMPHDSSADASHSVFAAANAARSVAGYSADASIWRSVSEDLQRTHFKPRSFDLLRYRLWPNETPSWMNELWVHFVGSETDRARVYTPWINWYQALLTGNSAAADYFGPDLTLRIAQQSDEWWSRPAAEVNADITAWLVEKESAVELPSPEPGLVGTVDADGRIGFARFGEATTDELARVAGLLRVLTGAAEDLAALLVGNNSVAIAPSIVPQYLACLRQDAISIDMLYALGVRLGNARAKLQKQIDSKDYPDLAPDVAEALDSVLELHGPVLLSTSEGRRLVGASSDYLRTAADYAALKRAAMDYGQAVGKSSDLFNKETRELLPQLNEDVAFGPHPERSTQVAMSANRNLLITVATVLLFETLKDGLAASVIGIGMTGVTTQTINFAWAFVTSYLPVIRELAAVSGPYLQWIEPLLRKAEKRLRE